MVVVGDKPFDAGVNVTRQEVVLEQNALPAPKRDFSEVAEQV